MARLPPPSVAAGSVVADRYRVGQLLGVGGMGEVFEAQHLETGHAIAIKLLRESASETIVERFSREGKALAQLHSEHVIQVFDVGVLGNGRPFIVMELLAGADLSVIQRQRGVLPLPLAVSYVLQASVGIAEAHGLGIVHRDLKPANLYRAELSDGGHIVKVLDFGISKVNAAAKAGKTGLTEAGDVFGSPRYMSPEQLRASRDVDKRADIWSLGVTLAELVTGKTPFHAEDFGTLLFNILEAEPPSVAHVDETRGAALDAVIGRCLVKDPTGRFSDIAMFADALAPLVEDGRALAARVRDTLRDARVRASRLEGRSPPQITRVLDPPRGAQTTAVLRIAIAPVAPRAPSVRAAPSAPVPTALTPPAPARRRAPVALWLGAAAVLAAVAIAGGVALVGAGESTAAPAETREDQPKSTKKKKAAEAPAESAKRPSLGPASRGAPAFTVAKEIGGLLEATHPAPLEVRDLLFFADRAVLVVGSERELVRYDYAAGVLSDPAPAQAQSGARRGERLPYPRLDLGVVPQIAEAAGARFGAGKLHSIGLLWLADEILWVAASKDGGAIRYHLDGRPRDA